MSIKSKITLPFKLKFNTDVSGGYATKLHKQFYKGTQITNYHEDNVNFQENADEFVVSLQSPVTSEWVGGRSHRHVPLGSGEMENYIGGILSRWEQTFEEMQNMQTIENVPYIESNEYGVVKTGSLGQYYNKKLFVFNSISSEDRVLEIKQSFIGKTNIALNMVVNRNFLFEYGTPSIDEDFEDWLKNEPIYSNEPDINETFETGWIRGEYTYSIAVDETFENGWTAGRHIYPDTPDIVETFENGWTAGRHIYPDTPDIIETFEDGWTSSGFVFVASPEFVENFDTNWIEGGFSFPDNPNEIEDFENW